MTSGLRLLAASTTLALALVAAGCSGDEEDGERPAGTGDARSSGAAESGSGVTATPEEDGAEDGEGLPRGASVDKFCSTMQEIDDSIDEARAGDDADFERVLAAFDALWEVGAPDDFPAAGEAELLEGDRLLRESDDLEEFGAALERERFRSPAVEDYLDEHCDA